MQAKVKREAKRHKGESVKPINIALAICIYMISLFLLKLGTREDNLIAVKECLDKYMRWSGQAVNGAK